MLLLHGPRGRVHSLAFSPDGATLASVAGRSRRITLWDLAHDTSSHFDHTGAKVSALAFAPVAPPTLAWCDSKGSVHTWNTNQNWDRPLDRVRNYRGWRIRL